MPSSLFTTVRTLACLLVSALLAMSYSQAHAQNPATEVPEANPARPTVSAPATLSPVGYLQFENGTLVAEHSGEFSSRVGAEQCTKLTVLPRLQMLLQSELYVHSGSGNQRQADAGDVFGGFQGVVLQGQASRPTLAVSYLLRLHSSPASDLDVGSFRQGATVLVSSDLRKFHFDLNGMLNEQAKGNLRRAQSGQTLSISHPLGRLTIAGELWHFTQPFLRGHAVGNLWAISYSLRKNLILDMAINRGLTRTSTRWEQSLGFTYLLPHRLWKSK